MASLLSSRIAFVRVDGDVPVDKRVKIVNAFNNNPDTSVCLITAQVGGVGLTFQSASRVILLDPSWNPAVDAQAVDRVHRIGQAHDVVICRLITCGTVDEMIYRNQVFKTMAAKQVASGGAGEVEALRRYFTHTELRAMFAVGDFCGSETARQLNELHAPVVEPELLQELQSVPGIAAISDNSLLFSESVADEMNTHGDSGEPNEKQRTRQRRKPRKHLTQVLDDIEQSLLLAEDAAPDVTTADDVEHPPPCARSPSPALSWGRGSGARCSIFEQGCSLADIVKSEVHDIDLPHFLFRGISMPVLQLASRRDMSSWADNSDEDDEVQSWALLEQAHRESHGERARRAATGLRAAAARMSVCEPQSNMVAAGRLSLGHADPNRPSLGHFASNRPSLVLGRPSQQRFSQSSER
jgi:hypothetical protein